MIGEKLIQMGITATAQQRDEIRQRIQSGVESRGTYPFWLTEEEVEAICRSVVNDG
jgi:hypothetical protein